MPVLLEMLIYHPPARKADLLFCLQSREKVIYWHHENRLKIAGFYGYWGWETPEEHVWVRSLRDEIQTVG